MMPCNLQLKEEKYACGLGKQKQDRKIIAKQA